MRIPLYLKKHILEDEYPNRFYRPFRPIRPADEIYNAKLTSPLYKEETSEEQE